MNKILSFIAVMLFGGFFCIAQEKKTSYQSGFKTLHLTDRSRIYKTGTDTTHPLYYRPLDIDIWYPTSINPTTTALDFKYFLDLYADRTNYYTASDAGNGLQNTFASAFCKGWNCSTPAKLYSLKTASYKDAPAAPGKFPVIIYMASYGNMGYENYMLFEQLAEKGFIILSIPSIGRFPGDMTMKNEDMLQQVYDARAAVNHFRQNPDPQFDFSRTAILGYSWGGLSGAVFSSFLPSAHCIISMEGSEYHHYNEDKGEDADFDGIKNTAAFQQLSIKVPYLRFISGPQGSPSQKDSVYNFTQRLSPNHAILGINGAAHQDFCCFPVAVRTSGNCPNDGLYRDVSALTISFLEDRLKNTHSFSTLYHHLLAGKEIKAVVPPPGNW